MTSKPRKSQAQPKNAAAPLRTIAAGEFKATCLDLMDQVMDRHIEVIVTKRGKPYAKLGPADAIAPDPFGFLRNTIVRQDDIALPDYDAWARSEGDPLGPG